MSYLIDTNVISELIRQKPNPNVLKWFANVPNDFIYVSVLTIGEIRKGVEKIAQMNRKQKLLVWLEHELPKWFQGRILSIDVAVADKWGFIQAETKQTLPVIDSLLAATAMHYDLTLVTRNVGDFNYPLLSVVNPWLN